MEKRPKIKLELTPSDEAVELAGWLILLAMWVLAVWHFSTLPDIIPVHFDAAGNPDGWGGKENLLFMPGLATALFVVMTFLNRQPHIFNYSVKITEENAPRQYALVTRLVRYTKLSIALVFLLITWMVVQSVAGKGSGFGRWVLPLVLALFTLPVVLYIIQARSKTKN
jgi:uncharacterized membrane protein